jgi:predicted O-methyltransferase YrrM
VSEPTAQDIDAYFDRILLGDDPALTAALEASDAAGLPTIAVSSQYGKFLYLLAMATHASRVLEIGTLGGFSTIWLARAVGPAGHVVTLEYEPKHAQVARANLSRAGVADRVEVIVGAALDTLPGLAEREPFDLVFIDADKENNSAYVQWAIKLGAPGSIVVVDNVVRAGRVLDPAPDDHQARGVRDMWEMIAANPRLEAAAIQTVGAKGWDGFALAIVK